MFLKETFVSGITELTMLNRNVEGGLCRYKDVNGVFLEI